MARKTPLQDHHKCQFALKVSEKNAEGVVIAVSCLFCAYFGRENAVGQKRKRARTTNTQIFRGPPFRPEQYSKHHSAQHPVAWAEYQAMTPSDKAHFFEKKIALSNTLHKYMDESGDTLEFVVNKQIVNDVLGDMFYCDAQVNDSDDDDADGDGGKAESETTPYRWSGQSSRSSSLSRKPADVSASFHEPGQLCRHQMTQPFAAKQIVPVTNTECSQPLYMAFSMSAFDGCCTYTKGTHRDVIHFIHRRQMTFNIP